MKKITFIFLTALISFSSFFSINLKTVEAAGLATQLKGRILLQVEQHGEAWYVNPDNQKRYYMGRPEDAFNLMRTLGLGITNQDLQKIKIGTLSGTVVPLMLEKESYTDYNLSRRLAGKILLQVEEHGEAWYVNPLDLKRYYLGRPADAFNIMRSLGLGIKDSDLNTIPSTYLVPEVQVVASGEEIDVEEIFNEDMNDFINEMKEVRDELASNIDYQIVTVADIDYYKFDSLESNINYFFSTDQFEDYSEDDIVFVQIGLSFYDSMITALLPEMGFDSQEVIDLYVDSENKIFTLDFVDYGVDLSLTEESAQNFSDLMQTMEDEYAFDDDDFMMVLNEMTDLIKSGQELDEQAIKTITDEIAGVDTAQAYVGLEITF